MNIRFYNARILTMADFSVIEGELWVEGNKISYVGSNSSKPSKEIVWDREIDVSKNLLMPGFKNAHTHSGMTFLRSYADDMPLLDWLHNQVFPMEAKLNHEHIYDFSKLAIMEYLTSGITANFDMYLSPEPIAKASVDCGFRTVMVGSMNNFTQSVELMEEYYKTYQSYHELIDYQLGFHAEYTTDRERLEGIAALAKKYKAPVYTHNSESKKEVAECLERYQMTPTAFLDSLGMFEYGGGGYHCIHMTEEDMAIFKERGMSVVTNPGSNVKLASGIAPLVQMKELGINLAIGTDGPASNNCLDMFREMFLVTGLQKLKQMDAAAMDGNDVLYMATVGGAKAMGLDECDILAEGKLADIIMIDLSQPNMRPIHNITKNIVYSGSKQNVKMTMVNGKILYEDGRFYIGEEPLALYERVEKIVNDMKNERS
ncbi:amidohydrolase family protein [Konateibacter massiliensis]|uniref:amidohydrolase family protein n=1 Tax=Konateibacter massiliensis TaxID=2002841 RepID=UPI000C151542|nr:amidohydrolase [Konateibacter massiliensis]